MVARLILGCTMADSGVHRQLAAALKAANPSAIITSTYRPGSRTRGTGSTSYHATGRAIDIAGPQMMAYFEWISLNYPNSAEVIYSPAGARQIWNGRKHTYSGATKADHYDHVHWAIKGTLAEAATGGTATPSADGAIPDNPAVPNQIEYLATFANALTNPDIWVRIGVFVGAAILLVLTLIAMSKRKVVQWL